MKTVSRIGRALDLAGLVLFGAGAAVFLRAWIGFQGISRNVPTAEARPWAAVEVANGFWRLQKIGMGLMVAGVAVFVLAWWSARAVTRRNSGTDVDSPVR